METVNERETRSKTQQHRVQYHQSPSATNQQQQQAMVMHHTASAQYMPGTTQMPISSQVTTSPQAPSTPHQQHSAAFYQGPRYGGPQQTSPTVPSLITQTMPQHRVEIDFDARFARLETLITQEASKLKGYIDEKFAKLYEYVDTEVARVNSKVDDLSARTDAMAQKMEEAATFDPDTTIVADNLPWEENEDLEAKVEVMIRRDLAVNVPIVRTTRLKPPPPRVTRHGNLSRPGLVKIQFRNTDDKIKVLREKMKLMNSRDFSNVYLRSSKTHSERLMEQNFKTILELLPDGKDYQLAGNGRLIKRDQRFANKD